MNRTVEDIAYEIRDKGISMQEWRGIKILLEKLEDEKCPHCGSPIKEVRVMCSIECLDGF